MCAIAGMVGEKVREETLKKMLSTMARRGPDDEGTYSDDLCTLLHTRLAVIDPNGGCQPMELEYGGEAFYLVYNGELYNTRQVRKELTDLGHEFKDHSDTEVVLHAYAQWGSRCLAVLNGIFAFAVWEKRGKRLFLARDRIGVKPLFYRIGPEGLVFASEIKTILACPGVRAELDEQGLLEILLLGPGRTPGCGVFRGVLELEPGCFGYFSGGKLNIERYWMLKDREHRESFEETAGNVRYLVTDAIRSQMVSDVPIGTFLSGGLDSSLISAICATQLREQGEQLTTFSVDYTDNQKHFVPGKFQPEQDGSYIGLMVRQLRCSHHQTILTPDELVEALEASTRARDLPGMADVDSSLLIFCRQIRTHVKVALSGECADEIFGGYPWYRDPEVRSVNGFPWAQNTRERAGFLISDRLREQGSAYVRQRYLDTLGQCDILPENTPEEKRMKEMMNLNFRWFMQTLLDRKDRMSMYSGLEVRVPFCDHRIAEYLYAVPWTFKDHQGREKGLLRKAMEGILPTEVLYRKKSPYPKTWDPKYFSLVSQKMRGLLKQNDAPLLHILRRDKLEQLLQGDAVWPWYGQLMGTAQTVAYMLQINSWLEMYNIDILI